MNELFYVGIDGNQMGPFSLEQLKDKKITRDTLVWTEGLENWVKAETVPVLKEILAAIPPPLPKPKEQKVQQPSQPPPLFNSRIDDGKYFGFELASKRERLFAALIPSVIFSILYVLIAGDNSDSGYILSVESILADFLLSAILGAILYPLWGGNLGHRIMGLQVISAESGKVQYNPRLGATREALKSLFGVVVLPVIWLLWDDDKQNLYDKVVSTYVIRKKQVR